MTMNLQIPEYVSILMKKLNENGYECFIVGGAIRSILLNRPVHDYDLTTNALPEETKQVFHSFHTIDTGLQHGTVTVVSNHIPVEITTYRKETAYKDHRHPDQVIFTRTIQDDCARRDFTINALCYNQDTGLLDFFHGKEDLESQIIRCIGNPYERFDEDALRILRAIRFASQLNFSIEEETSKAILDTKETLSYVSIERIQEEFSKFLEGDGFLPLLYPYRKVFSIFLPELNEIKNWDTLIQSLQNSINNTYVRLAILFCSFRNPKHTLKQLKYSNKEITTITEMISHKDSSISNRIEIKKLLKDLSCDFKLYLNFREAMDLKSYDYIYVIYQSIIQNHECYSLKQLEINGSDLVSLGYQGKQISETLNNVLNDVIKEKIQNKKEILIKQIKDCY